VGVDDMRVGESGLPDGYLGERIGPAVTDTLYTHTLPPCPQWRANAPWGPEGAWVYGDSQARGEDNPRCATPQREHFLHSVIFVARKKVLRQPLERYTPTGTLPVFSNLCCQKKDQRLPADFAVSASRDKLLKNAHGPVTSWKQAAMHLRHSYHRNCKGRTRRCPRFF